MTEKLRFGTDGIRGPAGRFPIHAPVAWALGRVLGRDGATVLLARDSRSSGPGLVSALARGVRAAGGRAVSVGLLPTPALSVLLAGGHGTWGVMVTASHNPPADNGLKVLAASGRKLDDDEQQGIEQALNGALPDAPVLEPGVESHPRHEEARALYLRAVLERLPAGRWLEGAKIVVDGSFGAGSHTGPALLEALGAQVVPLACQPDGDRINVGVGATAPAALAECVVAEGAHAGLALDGDADRGIMVSASGRVLDGDAMLYLLAQGAAVVGTVMSGGGLEEALAARGIELVRTPVGDRHVDAAVHGRDLRVGAETSGHVCLIDGLPTACGALSCLRVLVGGVDLDARLVDYHPWPRVQHNVRVTHRPPLDSVPALVDAQRQVQARLGDTGRILLRYSGTEPLLRVLVEGRDETSVKRAADDLVQAVIDSLGTGA